MKKVKLLLIISAIAIVPTQTNAQMAVTDPTGMANDIAMFLEKIKGAMEQTFQLGEQSISVQEMLKISKEAMDAITTVSNYVGKVEDLQKFKDAAQYSAELLKDGKNLIMNSDYDVEDKLYYMNELLNNVNYNIQLCTQFIQDFSPGNKDAGNLSDAERTEMKEDAIEEVEVNNMEIKMEMDRMQWEEEMKKEYDKRRELSVNAMFFNF